jgi:hypothetical protein
MFVTIAVLPSSPWPTKKQPAGVTIAAIPAGPAT